MAFHLHGQIQQHHGFTEDQQHTPGVRIQVVKALTEPIVVLSTSPTASSTGFMIFDSDYYDNNGTVGNFGNGPYPTPHNGDLKTDMIDLSGYTDVMVKMNSYFRTFQGQAFIRFYVNGTYNSQVEVHTDLDVNDSSPDDAVLLVRMPNSVPGNANVQIEFQFEGTTQSNVNGSGYYFWMIDDIELNGNTSASNGCNGCCIMEVGIQFLYLKVLAWIIPSSLLFNLMRILILLR